MSKTRNGRWSKSFSGDCIWSVDFVEIQRGRARAEIRVPEMENRPKKGELKKKSQHITKIIWNEQYNQQLKPKINFFLHATVGASQKGTNPLHFIFRAGFSPLISLGVFCFEFDIFFICSISRHNLHFFRNVVSESTLFLFFVLAVLILYYSFRLTRIGKFFFLFFVRMYDCATEIV